MERKHFTFKHRKYYVTVLSTNSSECKPMQHLGEQRGRLKIYSHKKFMNYIQSPQNKQTKKINSV